MGKKPFGAAGIGRDNNGISVVDVFVDPAEGRGLGV